MKTLKALLLKDWKFKLLALLISFSLWSVVNFGSRTTITVSRYVEIEGAKKELTYKVKPERVSITVYVVERLLLSKMIERVRAVVDVSDINKKGAYMLRVKLKTAVPVLIHPASVDPPMVRVFVKTAPKGR